MGIGGVMVEGWVICAISGLHLGTAMGYMGWEVSCSAKGAWSCLCAAV